MFPRKQGVQRRKNNGPAVVVRTPDVSQVVVDQFAGLIERLGLQDDHPAAVLEQVARSTDVDGSFLKQKSNDFEVK